MGNKLEIITSPAFEEKFAEYPGKIRSKMEYLRKLVRETAEVTEGITKLEETLKWGEPSFVTKHGSTLRMDWKNKSPEQYAMYFQCSSRLVETFRTVFGKIFNYEGSRAIIFRLDQKIPTKELQVCIKTTLTCHKVKHLPTLGI